MNTVTYGATEEKFYLGARERTSYGIAAYADSETDGTATVLAHVSDITCDKAKINELVELCNSYELSILHLNDIVEDFLAL